MIVGPVGTLRYLMIFNLSHAQTLLTGDGHPRKVSGISWCSMKYKAYKAFRKLCLFALLLFFIGHAFKYCTEKGEWWSPPNKTKSYSHYHKCNDEQEIAVRKYLLSYYPLFGCLLPSNNL